MLLVLLSLFWRDVCFEHADQDWMCYVRLYCGMLLASVVLAYDDSLYMAVEQGMPAVWHVCPVTFESMALTSGSDISIKAHVPLCFNGVDSALEPLFGLDSIMPSCLRTWVM